MLVGLGKAKLIFVGGLSGTRERGDGERETEREREREREREGGREKQRERERALLIILSTIIGDYLSCTRLKNNTNALYKYILISG